MTIEKALNTNCFNQRSGAFSNRKTPEYDSAILEMRCKSISQI